MGVTPATGAALVALGGTLPDRATLETLRSAHTVLVAADGAAVSLAALGLRADVVVGDLDSLGAQRAALEGAGATVVEIPDQESNDFEKALLWCRAEGYERATIVGIDGGMVDHTVNNFSVLARHALGMRLEIRSGAARGVCVVDRLELASLDGERISLLPLPSARLTTEGLAWELRDEVLTLGVREGASNRALGPVTIAVHEGIVLVVHYPLV